MATTTNYSWTTPDDTALVKDGAAAIRSLGSSIDTTTKALNPSTTLGDIEYRSATANTNTRLGIGTSGQVLAVNGGVPAWTTISSGGMTLIATANPSAASTISFTSIPTTYKKLVLVYSTYQSAAGNYFALRLNNDTGSNHYWYATSLISGAIDYSTSSGDTTFGGNLKGAPMPSSTTSSAAYRYYNTGTVEIWNADQTSNKWAFWKSGGDNAGSGSQVFFGNGVYTGSSAISQLDFIRSGTQTVTGVVKLYGVN